MAEKSASAKKALKEAEKTSRQVVFRDDDDDWVTGQEAIYNDKTLTVEIDESLETAAASHTPQRSNQLHTVVEDVEMELERSPSTLGNAHKERRKISLGAAWDMSNTAIVRVEDKLVHAAFNEGDRRGEGSMTLLVLLEVLAQHFDIRKEDIAEVKDVWTTKKHLPLHIATVDFAEFEVVFRRLRDGLEDKQLSIHDEVELNDDQSWNCGMFFCVCTLGLSFLPYFCIYHDRVAQEEKYRDEKSSKSCSAFLAKHPLRVHLSPSDSSETPLLAATKKTSPSPTTTVAAQATTPTITTTTTTATATATTPPPPPPPSTTTTTTTGDDSSSGTELSKLKRTLSASVSRPRLDSMSSKELEQRHLVQPKLQQQHHSGDGGSGGGGRSGQGLQTHGREISPVPAPTSEYFKKMRPTLTATPDREHLPIPVNLNCSENTFEDV